MLGGAVEGDADGGDAGGEGVADAWDLVRVPAAATDQVTPYFPMRIPRPGERWVPTPLPAAAAPPASDPPARKPSA